MQYLKCPLEITRSSAPNWVRILSTATDGKGFDISASPVLIGGLAGAAYSLTVKKCDNKIIVLETKPSTMLPSACPERHINHDGTFCIGLNAGGNITDNDNAEQWWSWLGEYLECQQWASKYRRWPPGRWLSHGNAGIDHLAMEQIAVELGWEEEVRLAIEYKEGWLAEPLPRHRKNSDMLVNQRLPCPRGCLEIKGNRTYRILRRKCPHKYQVSTLVKHEDTRRMKEEEFVRDFLSKGFSCCGTINECPFQKEK